MIQASVSAFREMDRTTLRRVIRRLFRERGMAYPQLGPNSSYRTITRYRRDGTAYAVRMPRAPSPQMLEKYQRFFDWLDEVAKPAVVDRYLDYIHRLEVLSAGGGHRT